MQIVVFSRVFAFFFERLDCVVESWNYLGYKMHCSLNKNTIATMVHAVSERQH